GTAVHLWDAVRVERTDAIKRLVALVACELAPFGAGSVMATNLPPEFFTGQRGEDSSPPPGLG
ncbi:MAG: hypothetical protein NZ869_09935, partial [Thermoanaerobaculum sp.]|nr:hypothetical protein [Thermoanaerobaculum sp.]